jgi:predicted deacylase
MDFHSGGSTMAYVPTLFLSRPKDRAEEQKAEVIIEAFGAPRLMYMDNLASDQMIGSVAKRHGAYLITGEFGGGGGVNLDGLAVVKRGIAGVLDRLGVLAAQELSPAPQTRRFRFRPEHYVFSPVPGIFEPACRLGDRIRAGQLAGLVHDPYRPWNEPERAYFQADGELFCLRTVARVDGGNFLAHLAEEEPQ